MSNPPNTANIKPPKMVRPALIADARRIRWALALVIGCAAILGISIGGYQLLSIQIRTVNNLTYGDLIKDLVDLKRDQSGKLFDVALLMLGALFALMIAKKDEARIVLTDLPEMIMFLASSVLLLASLGCDITYLRVISESLYIGGRAEQQSMPDIFSSEFEGFYNAQIGFLCAGVIAAAVTLFSAHRLKEVTDANDT
jgi:hypothetical protein